MPHSVVRWQRVLYAAATLSLVTALVHAWVAPEHFEEWWGYGTFFAITAISQAFYSLILLRRPQPPVFLIGIVGNLTIIVLYIVTRTAGIPLVGPWAGEVEMVELIDLVSKTAEAGLIIALVSLLRVSPTFLRR